MGGSISYPSLGREIEGMTFKIKNKAYLRWDLILTPHTWISVPSREVTGDLTIVVSSHITSSMSIDAGASIRIPCELFVDDEYRQDVEVVWNNLDLDQFFLLEKDKDGYYLVHNPVFLDER